MNIQPRILSSKPRGFSFVEILIALLIASVGFAFVLRFSLEGSRRLSVEGMKSRIEERVQVALSRMRSDIRYLGYDPQGLGTSNPYITLAGAEQFSFIGDIDEDNALETVSYRKNNDVFERAVSDESSGAYFPLATHLESLTLRYFDINGNTTANLGQIRKIGIEVVFKSEGMDPSSNPISWKILSASESFVPRNLLL